MVSLRPSKRDATELVSVVQRLLHYGSNNIDVTDRISRPAKPVHVAISLREMIAELWKNV